MLLLCFLQVEACGVLFFNWQRSRVLRLSGYHIILNRGYVYYDNRIIQSSITRDVLVHSKSDTVMCMLRRLRRMCKPVFSSAIPACTYLVQACAMQRPLSLDVRGSSMAGIDTMSVPRHDLAGRRCFRRFGSDPAVFRTECVAHVARHQERLGLTGDFCRPVSLSHLRA